MDEYTTDLFIPREDSQNSPPGNEPEAQPPATPPRPPKPAGQTPDSNTGDGSPSNHHSHHKGIRGRVAGLAKSGIQDRLVEKLISQVLPNDTEGLSAGDDVLGKDEPGDNMPLAERPNFNLTTMSNNFRRFNARIGVMFVFQAKVARLLSWQQPTHTISFLAVYTFVCLDPYLLAALPPAVMLLTVFIPAFMARHPAPPRGTMSSEQSVGYSPRGPPLAPAATVKPVKELSKDFFRNMRDLQNGMEDFSVLHDKVINLVVPATNFSDEAFSSTLFLALTLAALLLSTFSSEFPWRLVFLINGWFALLLSHPTIAKTIIQAHRTHIRPHGRRAASKFRAFAKSDVILDSAPETREVEIFELQRASSSSGEWEPWLFSASPHDPLSAPRIGGLRPKGTRFFEDVLPPDGWEWSEKKWALDLWSREWVEERIITGVEVETEGERWVYDMYDEREAEARRQSNFDEVGETSSVVDFGSVSGGSMRGGSMRSTRSKVLPSWEEGEDGEGKRGEWRRRRWVRLVKRKASPET
ncbi:integral peroxisomal membrane peroxin-domain-containing protein [Plectosphaerella plurivora]|uniref:Integral peroxisomal membrane peroxin-domain-containing protein n=1 Tax=Plectosphaerella plurivora TaxID=936078 RepID=A0A9P9AAE3_9PEZI|nr:integral peroxisomal membrane peroxin-domain-containing protein [Plectosphaerella plurivora]